VNNTNIYFAGVGGQGLVLSTQIVAETAFIEGYDVRTNDIIGLSQRGGKVYGTIRFGEKIYSPEIPKGHGDILVVLEKLEGLRWAPQMKKAAQVIMNEVVIFPNRVLIEKDQYPENINVAITDMGLNIISVNASELALRTGNIKTSNIVLLGVLSTLLPFSKESWINSISKNVPQKTIEDNIKAFDLGRSR
jgi:indolepyruvate ferredoxin oxidoreductase, beta subunit